MSTFLLNYLCSSSSFFVAYITYSYISDILFLNVLPFSFGEQFLRGNSVSPYCFPLPTVLLCIVFMMMVVIISCSISLYSGKKHD